MSYTAKTWVTGEVIHAVDLNHAEQGIATAQSGVDAISAPGAIGTANLAPAAVTNDKLDQEAVDSNNIRAGAIITPTIYDGAVTLAKLADTVKSHFALADDVEDYNDIVKDGMRKNDYAWQKGGLSSGEITSQLYRAVTTDLLTADEEVIIKNTDPSYKFAVVYTKDGVLDNSAWWITENENYLYKVPSGSTFRICVAKASEDYKTLTDAELAEIAGILYISTPVYFKYETLANSNNKSEYGFGLFDSTDFKIGVYYNSGSYYKDPARVCTTNKLKFPYDTKIIASDGYRIAALIFAADGTTIEKIVTFRTSDISIPANRYFHLIIDNGNTSASANVGQYVGKIKYRTKIGMEVDANTKANNVLDGWESHAKAFSTLMADVEETEGFMYFTDSHFFAKTDETDLQKCVDAIFPYLAKLYESSPCSFTLHGGDWLGNGEARSSALYKLSCISGLFKKHFDKYALLVGNHENGSAMSGNQAFTPDTLAATLLSHFGKTYYTFDANTFRMYCFDTWGSGALDTYGKAQIAWFADALTRDNSKHIVVALHILYDNNNLCAMGDEISKCAKAYNDRETYTYNEQTYDFSASTGKVGFIIAGHTHADSTGTVNDIPYIITINATEYSDTTLSNLPLPVDLIKVDWDNSTLTAYRAARGSTGTTRTLNIIS